MNAKKGKAIRQFLLSKGVNPREDKYIQNPATLRTKSYQTVTWVLAPGAGRRAYKGMKAELRRAA